MLILILPPNSFHYFKINMPDFGWSYEYLRESISIYTRNSSSPTQSADINPLVEKLLNTCPGSSILTLGGHSVLIYLSDAIVAKVSLKSGGYHLKHEQAIFQLLEKSPSPHIVPCLFRFPDVTFMEFLKNGTLYDRMAVLDTSRPIVGWMQQLSGAVASLESLGIVHGDINPRNIVFDEKDQLKLVDFDHALKIGDNLDVGDAPYVRLPKRGEGGGIFGIAGPPTEQFALGSIFWFMTRGDELYHELAGPEQVDRLMNGQFPRTNPRDPVDRVILACWLGEFETVAELSKRICACWPEEVEKIAESPNIIGKKAILDKVCQARKNECQRYCVSLEPTC